eukprot:8725387-Pyramimonas_sp.AAC.1
MTVTCRAPQAGPRTDHLAWTRHSDFTEKERKNKETLRWGQVRPRKRFETAQKPPCNENSKRLAC